MEMVPGSSASQSPNDWITLNVGGEIFATTRDTLCRVPDSMLGRMFAAGEGWAHRLDSEGRVLVDRGPRYFHAVLDFLRHGKLILDKGTAAAGVLEEARFYGLVDLAELVESRIGEEPEDESCDPPLTRTTVSRIIAQSPYTPENQLRFQGLDLRKANLSYLDLRNVNFRHAKLDGANLSHATLNESVFEWASLKGAILDGAQMLAVKMTRANLEGASLKGCNFDDPHQTPALLEGVNLKGATLEGSMMCGANLRVASLKNAVLRNCDLKAAVLAGADLENCDLSGSDLFETNLRGANFTGATFEGMLTPLHMSQTLP